MRPKGSAHPGTAAGHLRCGLAAPLAARLDSHDPLAELARHSAVELDLGRVGPTTVTTMPVSNDGLHERSLSRRRPATDAYRKGAGPSGESEKRVYHALRAAGRYAAGRGRAEESRVSSSFCNFSMSIGLTRWWSKPASRASWRSLSRPKPVSATISPNAHPRRLAPQRRLPKRADDDVGETTLVRPGSERQGQEDGGRVV